MNTRSGKLMLFGIMLLMFALVLALVGVLNVQSHAPIYVADQCTPVVIIVALAGLVSGFLGLRGDD